MADPFIGVGATAPARKSFAVTASDSADLATATRGLYVGTTGDAKVTLVDDPDGTARVFVGLAAGVIHPLAIKRLWSTGTTASNLIGVG